MGRGRVEMKRIESKINRQVTFSKRKSGLQKKAHEISVLCDAEVVLIIFSARGKMFEYSSNLSMENILERYERYSYAVQEVVETEPDSQGDWSLEHIRLNTRLEALQRNQRHLKGEDLDSLTLKQLQHLEKQLETAMKHIRLRKNQLMYESLSELRIKEKALQKENNMLGTKIKEKESVLSRKQKQQKQNQAQNSSPCLLSETIPSLNIGGTSQEVDEEGAITQTQSNRVIPPWMLRHVNE